MYFPKVRLELSSTPYVFNFTKQPAALSITAPPAVLEISAPAPKLNIDQTLPREEAGSRTMLSFARYTAEQAREDVLQAIQETAREGDRLAQIQIPKSGIVENAEEKVFRKPDEYNIKSVPSTPPAMQAEISPLSIRVTPGNLSVQFAPAVFQYQFQFGSIKGQLVPQGNSLDLSV